MICEGVLIVELLVLFEKGDSGLGMEVLTQADEIKLLKEFDPLDPNSVEVHNTIGRNELGLEVDAGAKARLACINRIAKSILAAPNMATRTIIHRQNADVASEVYTRVQELISSKTIADKAKAQNAEEAKSGWTKVVHNKRRSVAKPQVQIFDHQEGEIAPLDGASDQYNDEEHYVEEDYDGPVNYEEEESKTTIKQ